MGTVIEVGSDNNERSAMELDENQYGQASQVRFTVMLVG